MSYNVEVTDRADQVAVATLAHFLGGLGQEQGTILASIAGGGKSHFVVTGVGRVRRRHRNVAVAAPTNEQAFGLVRSIARRYPRQTVTFVPASSVAVPEDIERASNVFIARPAGQSHGANILVGTLDKLGDALARGDLPAMDALLIDEAFQADSTRYYAVGDLAPTHLLVGDSGQLNPFSTIPKPDRWRGLPEDPLQTAVGILRRNHPDTSLFQLPISRRLDPRAVPVVSSFYLGHDFGAAVLPDVRQLDLVPGVATTRRLKTIDATLDVAARDGWAHLELPDAQVLTADPETVELIVDLVRRLADRSPEVRCELAPTRAPLQQERVAIGVSHNDQKGRLRAALTAAGYPDVVVNTANKLQGLEYDLVIAWHPLAGLPDPDGFHLDPGRLCVLCTRHRHACIVIGRAGDRALLDGMPPSTPAYLDWDPDPVLDGWGVHQSVFDQLEPFRIAA